VALVIAFSALAVVSVLLGVLARLEESLLSDPQIRAVARSAPSAAAPAASSAPSAAAPAAGPVPSAAGPVAAAVAAPTAVRAAADSGVPSAGS
jgi:hypothetical protein